MRLLFKQCMFPWFSSYGVHDETGDSVYTVGEKMSWGRGPVVYNAYKGEAGEVKEEVFAFLPRFRMYMNDECSDMVEKELSFFKLKSHLPYNDWAVYDGLMEWEYGVISERGGLITYASKELFHSTDTYVPNIQQEGYALPTLMIVLAIDAARYSHNG